jgi:hypothetical protein
MQDNSRFTEAEAFRLDHVRHLERQTQAIKSIKNYVAIRFWCSVAAALLFLISSIVAAGSGY